MSIKGINFKFNGPTTSIDLYDDKFTNLGSLIKQYTGPTNKDKFAGPAIIGLARPMEQSINIPGVFPHVITYSNTIDWVFLIDNATAAATRRVILYEYNKETSIFNWKGFITLTYPTATVHTVRGFRVVRELYTNGTISVSGTAVTGVGTTWLTDEMCVGSRIGFESNNPNNITTWYEIASINSNTSITLTSSAGTITSTNYVIDDIIILTTTTNATVTNGGLFITKGIRPELFISTGTTIPTATTVDNIRAVYWLSDAATLTNTIACGCAIQDKTSWINAIVYVLNSNGATYVYNFRKALTLTAGKDTSAFVLKTGVQALTGTISQLNNGRIGKLNHGPGNNIDSLYFVTTTRIYRADLSLITSNSTTWISDVMVEIPPGGVTTYLTSNVLSSCEISSGIDRLVVISTGAAGVRSYVTEYNTISSPMNHIFLNDDKQQDQSTSDSGGVVHPSILGSTMSVWSENGILYLARIGTTAAINQLYTIPIGAHQTYAIQSDQMLITPKFDISDANKLYNVSPKYLNKLGTDTFSLPTEPFKMFYRTSGINNNTGSWLELDEFGDLSGVIGTEIQFMFIFKILGTTCIPARIMGINLLYEDNTTDSHYEPSILHSSINNLIFAYRQRVLWNGNIPNLRIQLYNATTGTLLIDDNITTSAYGIFEYSTNNGVTWLTWNNTSDVVGNYIRYKPNALPNGVKVRSLLTQA